MRLSKETYDKLLKIEKEQIKIKEELKNLDKRYYVSFVHEEYARTHSFLYDSGIIKQELPSEGEAITHKELINYMNRKNNYICGVWQNTYDFLGETVVEGGFVKYLPTNNLIVIRIERIK